MTKKFFIYLISWIFVGVIVLIQLVLLVSLCFGEDYTSPGLPSNISSKEDQCINPNWIIKTYTNESRGEVILYKTPSNYVPTVTNLACITAKEFLSRVNNMPTKAVVGIISKDYTRGTFIQWNLKNDYMLLADIDTNDNGGLGKFIYYPEPLTRIKEILTNKPFPKVENMSEYLKAKVKSNIVKATSEDLKALFNN